MENKNTSTVPLSPPNNSPLTPGSISPPTTQSQPLTTYITGSQLVSERKKLPIGIYIIVAWSLLAALINFEISSNDTLVVGLSTIVVFTVSISLLFRLDIARKIEIGLLVMNIVLGFICIFLLFKLHQLAASQYHLAINKLEQTSKTQTLTLNEQQEISNGEYAISSSYSQLSKLIDTGQIKIGILVIVGGIEIYYLTRSRVREAFTN